MSADQLIELLLGPLGGLAFAITLIWLLLFTERLAPGPVLDRQRERNDALEAENKDLNSTVLDLTRQNAGMQEKLSALEREVGRLNKRIEHLIRESREK